MLRKLWMIAKLRSYQTTTFILVTWATVDTFKSHEWGWFTFFALALVYYTREMATAGAAYDALHREGRL